MRHLYPGVAFRWHLGYRLYHTAKLFKKSLPKAISELYSLYMHLPCIKSLTTWQKGFSNILTGNCKESQFKQMKSGKSYNFNFYIAPGLYRNFTVSSRLSVPSHRFRLSTVWFHHSYNIKLTKNFQISTNGLRTPFCLVLSNAENLGKYFNMISCRCRQGKSDSEVDK